MPADSSPVLRPLVFGEVLFDLYPDGRETIGGAPFNVSCHLAAFGMNPLFVSAIGEDDRGDRVLEQMKRLGMETAGVTRLNEYPTGTAKLMLEQGIPQFEITEGVAWDHIRIDSVESLLSSRPATGWLLYHGTLAQREQESRDALGELVRRFPLRFVDLNLRPPYTETMVVQEAMQHANTLKLNKDELATVTEQPVPAQQEVQFLAQELADSSHSRQLVVTLGEDGLMVLPKPGLLPQDNAIFIPPVKVKNPVDTVGAGDGVSAVLMMGRIRGWSLRQTLESAVRFGAALCGIQGALPEDGHFYDTVLQQAGDARNG